MSPRLLRKLHDRSSLALFFLSLGLLVLLGSCSEPAAPQKKPNSQKSISPKIESKILLPLAAEIILPAAQVKVYENSSVYFRSHVTGGKAPYSVRWDFKGASEPSMKEDAGQVTLKVPGIYEVSFEAQDANGVKAVQKVMVEVIKDLKPQCRIVSPIDGFSIKEGGSVTFSGACTGGNEPVAYVWNFGNKIPGNTAKEPGPVIFPAAGSYPVTFSVRDENGDTAQAVLKIEVIKSIPKAMIVSPEKEQLIFEGKSVFFSGTVSEGNPPFTYRWDFGGTGSTNIKDPGNVTFAKPGKYAVMFTVTDVQGDQASSSTTVTVVDDTKPLAKILTPSSDTTIFENAVLDFSGKVTGGDDPVKTWWDFMDVAPESAEISPRQIRFSKPGNFRVAFRATDATGDISEDSVKITVIRDTVPKVKITDPPAHIVVPEKSKVLFKGSVSEGNEPLVYIWQFGATAKEWRGKDPGEISFDAMGNYAVRFTVRDADGDTDSATVLVNVIKDSQPKAAMDMPLQDKEIYESESVAFQGSVKDGNLPIRFKWDFKGGAKNSDKENPGEVVFKKAGIYPVAFTVKDEDGDTDTVTRNITVLKSTWAYASGGWSNSSAIKTDGTLWAWGLNTYGQLGTGIYGTSKYPVQVGPDKNWAKVVVGGGFALALKTDRTLWAWGANGKGQLGIGSLKNSSTPMQIDPGSRWKEIAAGTSHSVAIRDDGSLWAWGRNVEGQLGDGTKNPATSPMRIGTENGWEKVAAGESHTLAVRSDGSLWAWGSNDLGQLGDETQNDCYAPKKISSEGKFSVVAAGKSHSIAIKTDGTLWAWGANMYGQLGDGTKVFKSSPVRIGKATDWSAVSAGEYHNIALKKNGTIWTWGWNAFGQLGKGTTREVHKPVQISMDSDWVIVEAGDHHSIGVKRNGSLWAWGYNGYSQLGDNGSEDRTTPAFIRPGRK